MKKIGGILNKKLNTVKETDTCKSNTGPNSSPRLPPGSPVFRRVRDELKTGNLADSKAKKYVNWDDASIQK